MKNSLDRINWLTGQWEGIQGAGIYHEEWKKVSDSELKGKAYMIKKGEIINVEILIIHEDDTGIFYTATVEAVKNGKIKKIEYNLKRIA